MSNFPDAHKVYDLAAVFRERVIEQGRSFLWPDQEIWTVENATATLQWLIEEHSQGVANFEQLASRLADQEPFKAMQIADIVLIQAIPSPISGQRELYRRVESFASLGHVPPLDSETWLRWKEVVPIGVVPPSGWRGHLIARAIGSFNTVRAALIAGGFQDLESAGIWNWLQSAVIGERSENNDSAWFSWEILSVLYPREVIHLPDKDARRIIDAFAQYGFAQDINTRLDDLKKIRELLAPSADARDFSFYSPEVRPIWDIPANQTADIEMNSTYVNLLEEGEVRVGYSHIVDDRFPIYELVEQFKNRAVAEGKSLLWPDLEVWTEEVITQFLKDFSGNEAQKGQSWIDVFKTQTSNSDVRTRKLLADSYAILMQFASTDDYKGSTKSASLNSILEWIDQAPDQTTLESVHNNFLLGIGSPGTAFSAAISHQIAYVPLFVKCLHAQPQQDIRLAANEALLLAKSQWSFKKTTVPARNIMLHLFGPRRFERIASRSHKVQIVDYFAAQLEDVVLNEEEDLDAQLRHIRRLLGEAFFAPNFDFYDDEAKPYWQGERPWPPEPRPKAPTIDQLAAVTYLDAPFLEEIDSLLKDKKQLIFEGPPGSGKTFVADKFARYFAQQPLDSDETNEQIELVQFHQSYSYEDFVEGIRPDTNEDGQLVYKTVPGIFREFADRAKLNPDKKFVLIIDEINRGNVSRILGELMLLLEYRDKSARLPYSKTYLQIPKNLYIIGTMNSADRSLSQIDYALRRRFYFVRFMSVENNIAQVLQSWLNINDIDSTRVLPLFLRLNALLEEHVGTDDLQVGHSYFMREGINLEAVQEQVWKYAVMPLLREYLYHHRERDTVLAKFELLRIGAPPMAIAEPSIEVGSGTDADVDAFADVPNHE